jgi:hypothetical protein
MRLLLARVVSIAVALGVLALLVVQATTSGCASQQQTEAQMGPPPPAPPLPSAPAPTPVVKGGGGPEYLPATKAAPVFYPTKPVAQPAQQSQAAPQQAP